MQVSLFLSHLLLLSLHKLKIIPKTVLFQQKNAFFEDFSSNILANQNICSNFAYANRERLQRNHNTVR